MRSENRLLLFFALLLVSAFSSRAQQGSIYFSAGYNTSWYKNSTIHIEQSELGNGYDLWRVKGTNKTHTPLGPLQLSYRLGFYCNEVQDIGIEVSFDPSNYTIADGKTFSRNGLVGNTLNVSDKVYFSRAGGSYYYFDGLNLFLANFVKRWRVYRSNSAKISVDMLGKAGIGPALPHFHSKLPVNPVDGGQLVFGGWNYGVEAACRATLFRYGYVELAGKYDYAMLDNLQLYQGRAKQNITSYQLIASIGFTLPTTRLNPLFRKGRRITTMLPWYNHKDDLVGGEMGSKKEVKEAPVDSLGGGIPEFGDIVDKGTPKSNPDSAAVIDNLPKDEAPKPDTTEAEKKHSRRWFKKHKNDADTSATPAADSIAAAPPVTDTPAVAPPAPAVEPAPVPVPEPVKEAEIKQADKEVIKEAIEGVNFESSKDIIQKSSYTVLDKVVKLMKDNPTYKLQINGHTDNKGSATFNKTLSQKRATAVKKYLTDRGVAGSRLKATGYGGERPIADNNTDEGKLKNRRVEFIIE